MKDNKSIKGKGAIKYAGVGLIILSFIFYGGLLFLPFTSMNPGIKGIAVMSLVIAGEASFWIGALLAGKEALSKYGSLFRIGKRSEGG
jgi:hypothetical protein